MILLSLLLSAAQAAPQAAVPASPPPAERPVPNSRFRGRLFISPMGEPFHAKSRDDDTLADWFRQANVSHDGRLTLEQMQKDAERFFLTLDVNHDGVIDPDEITRYETVVAPEIRTVEHYDLATLEGSGRDNEGNGGGQGGGQGRGHGGGGHRRGGSNNNEGSHGFFHNSAPDEHQGASRYSLLDLPEPVIAADTNFDRAVSLAEFRAAAQARFMALDLDNKGYLTLEGLAAIRPAPAPTPNKPDNSSDSSEGVPQ